jgi:hypothetical protein
MHGSLRGLATAASFILFASLVSANAPAPPFGPGGQPGGPPGGQPGKAIKEDMGKTLSTSKAQYATVFDSKAKRAKLVIPRKFIAKAEKAPAKEADGAEEQVSAPGGQNLMAGVAISLSLVTGGLWLARRGNGLRKNQVALLVALGVLSVSAITASTLWADLAPPPFKDKGKGVAGPGGQPGFPGPGGQPGFPGPGGPFGQQKMEVDVEITEKGDTIYLVMPGGFGGFPGFPGGPGGPGAGPGGGFQGGPPFNPGDPSFPKKDGGAAPKKDGGGNDPFFPKKDGGDALPKKDAPKE